MLHISLGKVGHDRAEDFRSFLNDWDQNWQVNAHGMINQPFNWDNG